MIALKSQKGFTLIELMVATAISAVIAVLAYQSVDSVATLKQQVSGKQQRLTELQRAQWQLQQDFMQMVPRPVSDTMGSPLPAVQLQGGESVELTRLAELPSPYQMGGLLRVRYQLQGDKLYRWVWPVLDRSPDTQPQKILLLSGVEQFAVQFYNAKKQPQSLWPPLSNASGGGEQPNGLRDLPLAVAVTLAVLPVSPDDNSEATEVRWIFAGVDGLPQGFVGFAQAVGQANGG